MRIEVWSDVVCPFCYIGKRRLEEALIQIGDTSKFEIIYKSFQLDPTTKHIPGKSYAESLAEKKGWTMDYTNEMIDYVRTMALGAGLQLNFEKAVSANTFDAHRILHLAHKYGKGPLAKEKLLKAHFIEGRNIEDKSILIQLATEIGLDTQVATSVLNSTQESEKVLSDINEARNLRISGVPFFVFDRKYAISGAQPVDTFVSTISKAFQEWEKNNPEKLIVTDSKDATCSPDKECLPVK